MFLFTLCGIISGFFIPFIAGRFGIKDMGKVMGALRGQYAGQMDFGVASGIIKQLLAG